MKRVEAANDYANRRYEELLMPNFNVEHVLRMPADQWPDPVVRTFAKLNKKIHIPMQGPSELGASGKLVNWNRTEDLAKLTVPTLAIGASHHTMDPAHMEMMAGKVQEGRFLLCPNGSHLAMDDDQKTCFDGLLQFIRDLDAGRF